MQLTVLGCAGSFPGPESACSAYLIEHDGFRLLVDLGNGALSALQRHCGLYGVDAVVVTHLHSDHCIDLVPWAVAWRYGTHDRPRLPVWGPAATQQRLADAYLCAPDDQLGDTFDFHVLTEGSRAIGPFQVESRQVYHPVETFGLRVSAAGRVIAYSSDTAPCDTLDALATDADLLLAEASFVATADNPPGVHLTGAEAGAVAAGAGVGRLLLTHLVSWHDESQVLAEAAAVFDGDVALARAGHSYRV